MNNRVCAPCNLCCKGWIKSKLLNMDLGRPCAHCTDAGCGIYENRPENPCVAFECGWVTENSPLPEDMRPDRCGAIVILGRRWNGMKVVMATPTGETIPQETLDWLMAYARDNNIPLIFGENLKRDGRWVGKKKTGYGPPRFVREVRDGLGPKDIMRF